MAFPVNTLALVFRCGMLAGMSLQPPRPGNGVGIVRVNAGVAILRDLGQLLEEIGHEHEAWLGRTLPGGMACATGPVSGRVPLLVIPDAWVAASRYSSVTMIPSSSCLASRKDGNPMAQATRATKTART